jgi:site-specific recombinase XerD
VTLLDVPRQSKKLPAEVYTEDEVRRLLLACNKGSTGVRNRALIVTLYRAGLRISEALGLRPKDLDRAGNTVRVLHGKGDKARTVGMDDGAFREIDRWLEVRDELKIHYRKPLFCTLAGEDIEPAYVRALLPRLAKRAGIHRRVHAHGFRHSCAVELAREGVDLMTISAQLGHSSTATTDTYLRHLAPQQVIETMRGREFNIEGE